MFGPRDKNPFLRNPEFNKEEYEQNLRVEAQLRKFEEEALRNTDVLVLGCPETARVRLYDQAQKTRQAKSKSGGGAAGGGRYLGEDRTCRSHPSRPHEMHGIHRSAP